MYYSEDARTPYEPYGKASIPYIPTQKSLSSQSGSLTPPSLQQRNVVAQQKQHQARLSKAQALALVQKLKRWIVVASFLSFGTVSGLVMTHAVGTQAQAQQNTTSTTTSTSSSTPSSSTSSSNTTSSNQSSGSFLQQQGGSSFGSSSSSQPSSSSSAS